METYEKEYILYSEVIAKIEHICMEYNLTFCQVLGVLDAVKDDYMVEFKTQGSINEEDDN